MKLLQCIYDKYENEKDDCVVKDIEEISSLGIKANVNDETIYVGKEELMNKIGITYKKCDHAGTIIYVASESKYYGHIVISDMIKDNSKMTIDELNKMNIKTVMLTGDNQESAKFVADQLNIKEYYYNLMPKDKVKIVQKLENNSKVAFVGDGVNDAPVLTRSDLGISLGGIGSDIAVEASNIVLMNDNVYRIVDAINISNKVSYIVKENIIFAILVKFLVMILTLLGFAPLAFAIFADVGVTVLAILNALRTLKL